jgi:transcriptional regulator with PAS, ATPase and Fis domain
VVTIHVPPLRERLEDLPALVFSTLEQLAETTGIRVKTVDDKVWQMLRNHSWPGNVRELRNILERALHLLDGDHLKVEHIAIPLSEQRESSPTAGTLKDAVRMAEKSAILKALATTNGDKLAAANLLNISKSSLYQKMDAYDLGI